MIQPFFLCFNFRRFYFLDREQSVGDPDTTYLTVRFIETRILILKQETRMSRKPSSSFCTKVPNIPLLTGFHKIRGTFEGFLATGPLAVKLLTKSGRGM